MKYLLFILAIFIAFGFKAQQVSPKNLIGKTFTGVTAMPCAKPAPGATGCFNTHYFIEISFKKNNFLVKNFIDNCDKIALMDTQIGKWKIVGNQVIFSPEIFDSYKGKLNIYIVENQKGEIFGINDSRRIDFYLK